MPDYKFILKIVKAAARIRYKLSIEDVLKDYIKEEIKEDENKQEC